MSEGFLCKKKNIVNKMYQIALCAEFVFIHADNIFFKNNSLKGRKYEG